jgi:hypothetical protein
VANALTRLADGGGRLAALLAAVAPAPQAFRDRAHSLGRVATALVLWAGQLADDKRRAGTLDRVARELRHRLREAVSRRNRAQAELPAAPDRQAALDLAVGHAKWVRDQLDAVIDEARALRDEHVARATATASAVARAAQSTDEAEPAVGTLRALSFWTARAAFVAALLETGPAGWTAAGVLAGAITTAERSSPAVSTLVLAADGVLSAGTPRLVEVLRSTGSKDFLDVVRAVRPETFDVAPTGQPHPVER